MPLKLIAVGVSPNERLRLIQRVAETNDHSAPYWRVWIAKPWNSTDVGTFLALHPDGSAERVTFRPDGSIDTMPIKPQDK